MASSWTIKANGSTYGPYAIEQMRGFAREGRLAPHSEVSRGTGGEYRMAGEDAELASLFRPVAQPAAPRPAFFTADGDIGQSYARREVESSTLSRFIIIADMKSRSIAGLEEEIFRSGSSMALTPQSWLLTTEMSLNALRNALIQKLGRIDVLFIIDVVRNKAAWFGYGPEADSRIRRIWQEAQKSQAAE
jgi:hypothetical protein